MKIRHPVLIKGLGLAGSCAIRLWMGTLRYQYRPLGANMDPHRPELNGRYIYAFWHENLLLPAYHYGRPDIRVLISQHADGQLIAEVCRHLRFRLVRGSTTRGGVEAVRQMLRASRVSHLAITPDGPRGPRRQVQMGLLYLAARTELPIVPTGIGFQRPWRLGSWDRFAVPRPWSLSTCVTTDPIHVPADADKDRLEHYRQQVEQALWHVTELAEQLAVARRGK
jgi:lysophospholipid acyltransferase (LPLAT)-like uncharacterized protein